MDDRHSGQTQLIFFNDTATTEIYTLSLHDALPICHRAGDPPRWHPELLALRQPARPANQRDLGVSGRRSEEHTSELQSRQYLVCRLLLDKKSATVCDNRGRSRSPFHSETTIPLQGQ